MTRRDAQALFGFAALAVAILAFVFRDAWLHGYVLGQAEFLFDYLPWQANRPAGWRVRNPLLGDPPMVFYPFLFHARSEILSGRFPLWSSAIGGGQPFFGAIQTAVLSPFTLFDYAFPFPWSFTLDVAARLFTGGVGMYLFLRQLPVSPAAAMFGGIAYLLNPFSFVWLEHPLSAVAACLPWMLLAVERCAIDPNGRSMALLATVTALMLFAGHPETAFKVLLLAGSYAVYVGGVRGHPIRRIGLVAVAMLLGALIASVQILPFLEYVRGSRVLPTRAGMGGTLFTNSRASFATAFVPDFFGTPIRRDFLTGDNYCEQQVYAGLAVWMLAAVGPIHRFRRGRAVFFLSAGAIAGLIMYRTPIASAAVWLVPPLRVVALSRFGLIVIAGLIVASALGLDEILQRASSPRRNLRSARLLGTGGAALITLVVIAFLVYERPMLDRMRHWDATVRSTLVAAVWLTSALALIWAAGRLKPRAMAALCTALIAADLLWFGDGFHPLMPRAYAFPATEATTLVRGDPDVFRVVGWLDVLLPNTALVYGLHDVRSYDGVGIQHYMELLDVGFHYTGLTHQLVNVGTPRILDLLNVKYLLTPPDIDLPPDRFARVLDGPTRVYRNLRVQPRAFLVDRLVSLSGNAARRAMRDTLDLTRVAVLDRPLDRALEPEAEAGDPGRATILRYEDARVSVGTRAGGRRLLVLTDVDYPGWRATVDGVEVPIHRADFAFRAVSVPAGEHLVEFQYRPGSVRYGVLASSAGIGLLALMVWGGRRRGANQPLAEHALGPR